MLDMIILIDTNALHGDVYADGQDATALFDAVAEGRLVGVDIWTPRGVVHELVRQFPERLQRVRKAIGAIDHDLYGLGVARPEVQKADDATVRAYRARLETRLQGPGRRIAEHPPDIGLAIDWAARHRHPVKPKPPPPPPKNDQDLEPFRKRKPVPVTGVVDAAIWLTVIQAAGQARHVSLISSNSGDFSDGKDKRRPHPKLVEDLEAAGRNPAKVEIFHDLAQFNARHIEPLEQAIKAAQAFLDDGGSLEALKADIADAIEWIPVDLDARWGLRVDIDEAALEAFDPTTVELVRADPGPSGVFMRLRVTGDATLDLGIRKADVADAEAVEVISIYDYDYNESMVAAQAELPACVTVEARLVDGDLSVAIEEIGPIDG